MREFRKTHPHVPGSRNIQQIKYRYGLSLDEYISMFAAQNNQCAICKQEVRLCVDHDHETDKVRGLLCFKCNAALGLFNDSVDVLSRASDYLKAHK